MGIREMLMGKGRDGQEVKTVQEFNAVKITGTVGTQVENRALIVTENTSGEKIFQEHHVVELDDGVSLKEGKRVTVVGKFQTVEAQSGETETIIRALKITKPAKDTPDQNIARVIGKAIGSFKYFPRTEGGKVAFGNLRMVTGEKDAPTYHQSVAFGNLANRLDRNAKHGAIIQIQGPVRYRPFNKDGIERTATEVVAMPDVTKVLVEAKVNDPFADAEFSIAATDNAI